MQHLNISHSTRSPEKLRKKPKGPIRSAAGVLQTQQQGKLLGCFPGSMENNKEDKDFLWEPLAFKLLMTLHDWFKIARAYLTKDEFLLWRYIYIYELGSESYLRCLEKKRGMKELTYEMFMCTEEWFEETAQQKITKEALIKISTAALES